MAVLGGVTIIKTARQPKGRIRNLSKENAADMQILLQNYMMECLLERTSISEYRDKFILEGGMLVPATIGFVSRPTTDIDTTIKGETLGIDKVERIIATIIAVPVDDSMEFHIKRVFEIMDEAEYPGARVSMETESNGVRTPLKINISIGDVIALREVGYGFRFILENHSIGIWVYNLGVVLAEKLKTVISRATTSIHMRNFYDLYILHQLYGQELIPVNLHAALVATTRKHGTEKYLSDAPVVFDEVETDFGTEEQWKSCQRRSLYATDLTWEAAMTSVRDICKWTKA